MLVIFKSKAAADVIMYEDNARRILDLIHKDAKKGIITAAETGSAIAALEAEIAASQHTAAEGGNADEDHRANNMVSFATRAFPFLEMLRAAKQNGKDVMWGV